MHKPSTEGIPCEPLKQTEIGLVPQSWEVLTLNDLRQASEKHAIVSGPFGSNIGKRYFVESGVPLIRGCNLTKGERYLVEEGFVFITEEKANELRGCVAIQGDLIFTAAGTLGQVGLIRPTSLFPKYIISNKQLRARLDKMRVRPECVFHWFATDTIQTLIAQRRGGASIPVINLSILKGLPVPCPSLEEQDRIVQVLAVVRRAVERQEPLIALTAELKKALMYVVLYVRDFRGNLPRFVYYKLHSLDLTRFKAGVAVPTLNRNTFRTMKVAVPTLAEQAEIATTLDSVNNRMQVAERTRAALSDLLRTLLHQLMTAQVRVRDVDLYALEQVRATGVAVAR